jgi:site-specific DNA-methyltransferase (adenine-specific)
VVWRKQNGTGFQADRFRRVHEHVTHWYRGAWGNLHHKPPRVFSGIKEKGRVVLNGGVTHMNSVGVGGWTDNGTRIQPSVIEAANMWRRGAVHPTEKPVELLDPLIRYACPPGGLVLDPFAGSGSTAVAARLSGRRAVLIEWHEPYCEVIAHRLAQDVLPICGAS